MFLTTHTGSLPRPAEITKLLQDREDGNPAADMDQRVEAAVRDVVGQQVKCGVDLVNDDEQDWLLDVPDEPSDRLRTSSRAADAARL
jgi:methionine synthase II (cobalamin-independent)